MSEKQILWCNDGKHDKVWGLILLDNEFTSYFQDLNYVTFWGRRGAKLQTKQWVGTQYDANTMVHKKKNKGYIRVDEKYLDEVYPEFQTDLEKTELWAKLKM